MPPIIDLESLRVCFGSAVVLDNVTLRVAPGEFVLLTGPSGCGKSTLARVLNGLIPHASPADLTGKIVVAGRNVYAHGVAEMAEVVGLVFQRPAAQLFCATVGEEVAAGPLNLGLGQAEVTTRTDWSLAAVGITHLRARRTTELSGGEQQRVAIAAVLAMRPRILILDEPTSHLDFTGTKLVLDTLKQLQRAYGVTILVIEHRLAEVGRLADRVLLMDQGQIVADGPPGEIFSRRTLLARLGVRFPGHVLDGRVTTWLGAPGRLDGADRSAELEQPWPSVLPRGIEAATREAPPLVQATGVAVAYGRKVVFNDLNLSLFRGEFVALVGENGTGKSTAGKLLAGLLKPRAGRIVWPERRRSPWLARRTEPPRVGLVLQDPAAQLFCDTVAEEVAFGLHNYDRYSEAGLTSVLAVADLLALRERPNRALSCGQQQRTVLAASLALEPELLIIDEPTLGQDWGHLSRLMDHLVDLNRRGMTILIITHDYKVVCRYVQRIVVLQDGGIVADGPPRLAVRMHEASPATLEVQQ